MPAVEVSDEDTLFHTVTLDDTATASVLTGPTGATHFWCKLTTSAAAYVQAGDQSGTNIASAGADQGTDLTLDTWTEIIGDRVNCAKAGSNRPAVSIQSDTVSTVVRYRWTVGGVS